MTISRRLLSVSLSLALAACGSSSSSGDPDGRGDGGSDGGGDGGPDGGSGGPAKSCVGLAPTCGPAGDSPCCESLAVVGGTYHRGYDVAGDPGSGSTSYAATVSAFRLDKYEVTVGRFRELVRAGAGVQADPPAAGAGKHAKIDGSGWSASWNAMLTADTAALTAAVKCSPTFQTWTDAPGANEARPMNCVTWYEAMAFCVWDGGYLATEAEWNYAATGGDEQRVFPWSTPPASATIDGTRASYLNGADCMGDGMAGCALSDLVAVGSKPAGNGRWGQADLAGNVSEWTLDWFSVLPRPCADCANLTVAAERAVRGGNFGQSTFFMRMVSRSPVAPTMRSHGIGFRCARAP